MNVFQKYPCNQLMCVEIFKPKKMENVIEFFLMKKKSLQKFHSCSGSPPTPPHLHTPEEKSSKQGKAHSKRNNFANGLTQRWVFILGARRNRFEPEAFAVTLNQLFWIDHFIRFSQRNIYWHAGGSLFIWSVAENDLDANLWHGDTSYLWILLFLFNNSLFFGDLGKMLCGK